MMSSFSLLIFKKTWDFFLKDQTNENRTLVQRKHFLHFTPHSKANIGAKTLLMESYYAVVKWRLQWLYGWLGSGTNSLFWSLGRKDKFSYISRKVRLIWCLEYSRVKSSLGGASLIAKVLCASRNTEMRSSIFQRLFNTSNIVARTNSILNESTMITLRVSRRRKFLRLVTLGGSW